MSIANTWHTEPGLPSWANKPGASNMAGRAAANNPYYNNNSLYETSQYSKQFNDGYNTAIKKQFQQNNSYGTTLQRTPTNYGGTYRRKNRKTRKTMRKRSYRRRR